MEESLVRFDGTLVNATTGLGRDVNSKTTVGYRARLQKEHLEELYGVWICRNIVDAYPEEATREWLELTLGEVKDKSEIIDRFNTYTSFDGYPDNYSIADAFCLAQAWANLYGGAVIIVLVDDGQPFDKPVDFKRIKSIKGLEVLDRHKIIPEYRDFTDVLRPEYYNILIPYNTTTAELTGVQYLKSQAYYRIHKSRLLRFDGVKLTPDMMARNSGWGASVLELIWDTFVKHETGYEGAAAVLNNFSLFVWKLKGLINLVKAGQEDKLRDRFRAMQMGASVFGGLAIDADGEEVQFVNNQFSGVSELLEKFREQLIGASGLPHTVLFGESPSGLGATGESEERTWAKMVGKFQKRHFHKKMRYFAKLVFAAKDGPTRGKEPQGWNLNWKSLIIQSDEEKISTRASQANTDRTYVDMGVLLPEEVRQSRFGGAEYSHEVVLDEKLWKEKQKEEDIFAGFDNFGVPPEQPVEEVPPEQPVEEVPQVNTDSDRLKYVEKIHGIPLGITHEPGDIRHGKPMQCKYGYIRGSYGHAKDGMAIDVYLGDKTDSRSCYRISQLKPNGEFDEYKYFLGFNSPQAAKRIFVNQTSKQSYGGIVKIPLSQLKRYRQDNQTQEKDELDEFTDLSLQQAKPSVNRWIKQIQSAIAKADNWEDAQKKLADIYEKMDSNDFAELMQKSRSIAHLFGNEKVIEEIENNNE